MKMAYTNNSLLTFIGPMPFVSRTTDKLSLDPNTLSLSLKESCFLRYYLPLLGIFFLLFVISNYIIFIGKAEIFQKTLTGAKRVLLVTAHPDDECMFFGPMITHLSGVTPDVYLICLSDGNYEGLGSKRSNELWNSCRKLGLNDENIRLYRHGLLPDNPKVSWSPLVIGHIVLQFVETLCIDTLITFDAYGVSGHSNHSAIYRALMHLSGKKAIPDYCKIYVLESVNILRKYSVCVDLLLSHFTSQYIYVTSPEKRKMILEAMAQHSSQLLWYRKLYLLFSRYCYINTIRSVS